MMQITYRCFFVVLLGVLSAVSGCDNKSTSYDFTERELSVIKEFLSTQMPVGDDLSMHLKAQTTVHGVSAHPERLVQHFSTLSLSTSRDFIEVNKKRSAFKLDVGFGRRVRIDFENELENVFIEGGWKSYYELYPKSLGIAEISRVGFNDHGDEALLYYVQNRGWMAGRGTYVLLRLRGDTWTIEDRYLFWIS
jgi:hypothetical protein